MTLIAQITDIHARPRGQTCYRKSETNMLLSRAVDSLLALATRPDAVVVTGDITDQRDEREYRIAKEQLSRLPMPVYLLAGNHDDSTRMKDIFSDFAGMTDGPADRTQYSTSLGDVQLIVLDSSVPGAPHGELGAEQLAWLDQELVSSSNKAAMIALHHPPVDLGIQHMDAIKLIDGDRFGDIVSRHGHVERIICGHLHRTIITGFAGSVLVVAPSVAHQVVLDFNDNAPAEFVFEPPAFFLHHHSPKTGMVTHQAFVNRYDGPYPFWADEGVSWPGY